MIAALSGIVRDRFGDTLVVDVNGVGYEVIVSNAVLSRTTKLGEKIQLIIYTDVKENAISLFGFDVLLERQVFLMLRKVKGIGSRTALTILSSIGAERLLINIAQEDVNTLQQVSGVGKKTAERIVVELRENVKQLAYESPLPLASRIEKERLGLRGEVIFVDVNPVIQDAVLALEKLGFPLERAKKAVFIAAQEQGREDFSNLQDPGELLRIALTHL